ncbi:MAG: chloride channel protein, partial [Epsilonproteobacteria bacterium]|nr:chloride channel protein [Campylobacterota bacterium]
FSIAVNFLNSIVFTHSLGREVHYEYLVPVLIFIPFITAFIYLYLFMKNKLLYFIDLEVFKIFCPYRNYIFSLIGGGVIGTILLFEPHAAFSGKDVVIYLINEEHHISLHLIFSIVILRIVATTVSIYSNAVGGIFLPLMSIGALIGYGFGELLSQYYHFDIEPFYFAAVGASVFMGVIMKLPLTAVVLALETTFDYNVMVATGISVVLVGYLSNIYFDIKRKYIIKTEKFFKITFK